MEINNILHIFALVKKIIILKKENVMKQVIKKKEFLTNEQRQERMKKERIERQNEILKNRSEGLKEWSEKHISAELIFDSIMNALDYVPPKEKEVIVKFLRMPILEFNHNYTDYLAYENDIDDMDAVFEILREIHDIAAKEVGLESYKEYSDNLYKEVEKSRTKKKKAVKKEKIEDCGVTTSNDDGLPF